MKHTVLGFLIAGYLSVALAGHLDVLGRFINSAGTPHQVESAKESRPIDSRPSWTQRKHLPPSTTKVECPSEAILLIAEAPSEWSFADIRVSVTISAPAQTTYPPYRPRDPPSA